MTKEEEKDLQEREGIVRSMISREDDLVNHRMSWLAAFNGLLFAALGFCWDKPAAIPLTQVFGWVGILVSAFHAEGIYEAGWAQRRLSIWWRERKPETYDGPGVTGNKPFGKNYGLMLINPWLLTATIFVVTWAIVLFYILPQAQNQQTTIPGLCNCLRH